MNKDILANILNMFGILGLCLFIKSKITCKAVYITAYHKIIDVPDFWHYSYDPELVSANSKSFNDQVRIAKKYFDLRTFENIDAPHKKPRFIITFDDGHKDNYEIAYPILRNSSACAVFYVSTDYIGTDKLFWFESIAYRILNADIGEYQLNGTKLNLTNSRSERESIVEKLLCQLKSEANDKRISLLLEIENIPVNRKEPAVEMPEIGNLTWDQVREMAEHGMEIGSHSVTHPVLSKLTDQQLKTEIVQSKNKIEEIIDKKVRSIAYPVGGKSDYDKRVEQYTRDAGYDYGLTYISGINKSIRKGDTGLLRLHVERYTSLARYKAMLAFPTIFA